MSERNPCYQPWEESNRNPKIHTPNNQMLQSADSVGFIMSKPPSELLSDHDLMNALAIRCALEAAWVGILVPPQRPGRVIRPHLYDRINNSFCISRHFISEPACSPQSAGVQEMSVSQRQALCSTGAICRRA